MTPPKVFISYSWKPASNKIKVIDLAERLSTDGVYVIIDEWDLKEGQDKHQFMEKMVNDPEVERVLIICNKDYAEKANSKKGGVGIESLILSNEIYENAVQTKFLPVIFEFENDNACVPTFIKSRIFFDLSSDFVFEENYEKLLRNIFDKPASKRPPIGTIPAFLLSEDPLFLPTAHKINRIQTALLEGKKNASLYIQDYLDTFITSLKLFDLQEEDLNTENLNEKIMKGIEDLKVLRDDFINFIETIVTNSVVIDAEQLHTFFEKLLDYLSSVSHSNYSNNNIPDMKTDHFRFFYQELFLTFATILISKERFKELAYILQNPFLNHNKLTGQLKENSFAEFRQHNAFLNEFRKKQLQLNTVSVTAQTIKTRATEQYNFDSLRSTDILLNYISLLFPVKGTFFTNSEWFPETSCYRNWNLQILPRTISKRYFDKVKILFGVDNIDELLNKSNEIKTLKDGFHDGRFLIPDMQRGLEIGKMCTLK